ncbi:MULTISPECIES: ArnT family glycosyltransferase [Halocynthiibacter]|uniref:Glycosyltransferase family 39 protein n=1 Tax=Halocynthiibacter halioticoli TaxID=2986804 RepID=A0AAE3IZW6_9RHOB|nr:MULTISPECIES: glycosyltransferase family 39 protein [Halocynthiibacter]MCV6823986.1 glycosyltransferase family 39 protein [Halocynthiibacter halioticoli]MCW4056987.1 glycosyltransferase family 39 protein [Halocynthiibacter sp. SDUM655004]
MTKTSTTKTSTSGADTVDATLSDWPLRPSYARALIATLFAFLLLRLWAMAVIPFTDTTEARYGEMARKMLETGNWITPLFDYGVPFWGKPPLHTWLSALGLAGLGISEFAARLPILLTGIGVLALTYLFARRMVGQGTALLSSVVLASGAMFFGASAYVMTDMPMALGTTLVMVGFWFGACQDEQDNRWGMLVFLGFAIGLMAKGPVAIVLCGIPTVLWLLATRRFVCFIRLPWFRGLALMLLLTVPWYALAEYETPGFLRYFIIGEHYERFVVHGWEGDLYGSGHGRPKGMIWLFWLGTVFPWTIAFLALLAFPRRIWRAFRSERGAWLLYLFLWMIGPMILFTPAANILPSYVLPGLPAAAILLVTLAGHIRGFHIGRLERIGFSTLTAASFALFAVVTLVEWQAPGVLNLRSHKSVVTALEDYAPDADAYSVGPRSFSVEFYTRGQVEHISVDDIDPTRPNAAYIIATKNFKRLSPEAKATLKRIDTEGRYTLLLGPSETNAIAGETE